MSKKVTGKPKRLISYTIITLVTAAIFWLAFELLLPAINLGDPLFWVVLIGAILLWAFLSFAVESEYKLSYQECYKIPTFALLGALGAVAVALVIGIASSPMFHAKSYANIMTVTEKETIENNLPNAETTTSIALMDTDSASRLGNRKIGSLSSVVSQYDVSSEYSQISYNGEPLKVSSLEYAGLFKYFKNNKQGVPGYVTVSPTNMDADYVELEKGMKYVPSAFFAKDLYRHVRNAFPTYLLDGYSFELDEEGNPYYTFPVYEKTVFLFGGKDVKGVITVDPVSGDMKYYAAGEVPNWVDRVFDGHILCEQYNWYGTYAGGFFNSLFAQTGCKKITELSSESEDSEDESVIDFGYIVKDNDVWVYTGVTSLNSDQSNVGFVLMNERTKECNFYALAGADEQSAMNAAEGELQQYGYKASFPSLIDIDGVATYIMVLKDDSGIVKQYAAVNVEQYNIVATATTQAECINRYNHLLGKGDLVDELGKGNEGEEEDAADSSTKMTITIAKMEYVTIDGDTWVYVVTPEGDIYKTKFGKGDNEKILTHNVGDTVEVSVGKDNRFDL